MPISAKLNAPERKKLAELLVPASASLLVLIAGLLLTFWLWLNEQQNVMEVMQTRFDSGLREFDNLTANRIYDYEQILLGMRSLFAASNVGRGEFRNYVTNLKLEKSYPGAQGVCFSLLVPPNQINSHIAAVRKEGYTGYAIKPETPRDIYTAAIYLEPFSGTIRSDFGFDNFTDATRRSAMEQARDTGELSISGKLSQMQEGPENPADIQIYLAVYKNGDSFNTVEERRKNILGWLYLPLHMDNFMKDVLRKRFDRLNLKIFDGDKMSDESLLFDSVGDRGSPLVEDDPLFSMIQTISIRGRNWTVAAHSLPDFDAQLAEGKQEIIIYSGMGGSLLMALLTGLLLYGRARIKRESQEIARGESRLSAVIDTALDSVIQMDVKGRIIGWNSQAELEFGWPREKAMGQVLEDLIIPAVHRSAYRASMKKFLVAPENFTASIRGSALNARTEMSVLRRDGREFQAELSMTHNALADGSFQFTAFFRDITKQIEREEAQRLASMVLNTVEEAVMVMDTDLNIINVNPAFTKITGFTAKEVLGKNPRILSAGKHTIEFGKEISDALRINGIWQGEIWDRHKNGETFIKWLTTKAVRNDKGTLTHYLGVFSDISERKAIENQMKRLAHHDTLTDLPNRTLFNDRLQQAMNKARRDKGRLALKFIDLDKFKPVNDTYGHAVGDQLLKEVAIRLLGCVRESDTVSRIGGDEFVILLPIIEGEQDARLIADKVLLALSEPFELGEHNLSISSSIGIAIYPEHGDDELTLTKNADLAMYHAKHGGRNNARLYEPCMQETL